MYKRIKCNSSFTSYSTVPIIPHRKDLSYPGNACRRLTLVGSLNADKSGGWRATKSRGAIISHACGTNASTRVREASSIC